MPVPLYQVDAFTDTAFRGNPAAVCPMERAAPAEWMRHVAAEMNLSETAFLVPRAEPSAGAGQPFDLRWFTPTVEVDLCGHATLASAHVLWETERLAPDAEACFHTRSGVLTARRDGERITLDFPATVPSPADAPPGLAEALGAKPIRVMRSRFDYLVEVEDEQTVRTLAPDFRALGEIDVVRGIIVTAAGSNGTDFVSRFFAPAAGVDEDPATGSAHCCLAPYWAEKLDRNALRAYQASERGGTLDVEVRGDRVLLGGQAVTVFHGTLIAEP